MQGQTIHPPAGRRVRLLAQALAACFVVTAPPAGAGEEALRLQGLFCNTEAQIDGALLLIGEGRTPRVAAGLTGDGDAACTYVDLLHYLVERPVAIGANGGVVPLVRYRGRLVGVVAGGQVRAVSPPVEVFFVTPDRPVTAAVERQA